MEFSIFENGISIFENVFSIFENEISNFRKCVSNCSCAAFLRPKNMNDTFIFYFFFCNHSLVFSRSSVRKIWLLSFCFRFPIPFESWTKIPEEKTSENKIHLRDIPLAGHSTGKTKFGKTFTKTIVICLSSNAFTILFGNT